MISRLTAAAVSFAVIATASLGFAASSRAHAPVTDVQTQAVQLPPVVITGKRTAPLPG